MAHPKLDGFTPVVPFQTNTTIQFVGVDSILCSPMLNFMLEKQSSTAFRSENVSFPDAFWISRVAHCCQG